MSPLGAVPVTDWSLEGRCYCEFYLGKRLKCSSLLDKYIRRMRAELASVVMLVLVVTTVFIGGFWSAVTERVSWSHTCDAGKMRRVNEEVGEWLSFPNKAPFLAFVRMRLLNEGPACEGPRRGSGTKRTPRKMRAPLIVKDLRPLKPRSSREHSLRLMETIQGTMAHHRTQ